MGQSYVAGIGGANVDIHGQSLAPLIMRDSNPGRLHVSVGGVTRNILDNLTRLGQRCELVSAVGGDVYGRMLLDSCAALGVGTRGLQVREDHPSSSYISIMDSEGDMLVAMSDMRVLSAIDADFVAARMDLLNAAPVVVCDGNLPAEALEYLAGSELLAEEGVIIVEAARETEFDYLDSLGFTAIKTKIYKTNKHVFIEPKGRKTVC